MAVAVSDDGDMALGDPDDREGLLDIDLEAAILELSQDKGYTVREIYDGLIRAARRLRHGRNLTEFV